MKQHIGVKFINAIPMNRLDYNNLRGWELPADEVGSDPGFLVEYLDGGAANVEGFNGYVSWSPFKVFNNAYRPTVGMNFGLAIEAAKLGKRIARAGWNGKNMFVYLVDGTTIMVEDCRGACAKAVHQQHLASQSLNSTVDIGSHFDMMAADGSIVVGWLASQTDMLADDWCIVD